jgi:hypothetical protein
VTVKDGLYPGATVANLRSDRAILVFVAIVYLVLLETKWQEPS